jgi:ABC-type nickel/cobalt efflux system permease component RcnA
VGYALFGGAGSVLRDVLGQVVGVVSIALWLGMTVYFMSRAADPTATDTGNWFAGFVVLTIVFVGVMAFWRRAFDQAHQ